MTESEQIVTGRYRHYKGGEYQVVATAKHSETGEWLVVYRCLYDDGSWWVRPWRMFVETVTLDTGEVPRFTLMDANMLDTDHD